MTTFPGIGAGMRVIGPNSVWIAPRDVPQGLRVMYERTLAYWAYDLLSRSSEACWPPRQGANFPDPPNRHSTSKQQSDDATKWWRGLYAGSVLDD